MNSLKPFEFIVRTQQALRDARVLSYNGKDEIVAVKLRFDKADVYLLANPDDDTVLVLSDEPAVPDGAHWISAPNVLLAATGKRIQWYWRMQNNQGYWDAFQIEFAVVDPDEVPVCVQVVAIASRLSVRDVRCVG